MNQPRYQLVPADSRDSIHSRWDIVDNQQGCNAVLAYQLRHDPAQLIVTALNFYETIALKE
jgi:hypothetical protein